MSHHIEPSSPFIIPSLPHSTPMNAALPKLARGFIKSLLEMELKSQGLIMNNFVELDREEFTQHYKRTTGHKAWHVGPACLVHRIA